MLSVWPAWCEKIIDRKKTVEVRKSRPKIEPPFKCYIYCSLPKYDHEDFFVVNAGTENAFSFYGGGKVIGEFVCNRVEDYSKWEYDIPALYRHINLFACIDFPELYKYLPNGGGYGWHISDLKIYDRPREITEFLTVDKKAVKTCPYRERTGQAEIVTKHNGWIKGSYLCKIDGITWCYPCHTKNIERPPQSWCYVEELKGV